MLDISRSLEELSHLVVPYDEVCIVAFLVQSFYSYSAICRGRCLALLAFPYWVAMLFQQIYSIVHKYLTVWVYFWLLVALSVVVTNSFSCSEISQRNMWNPATSAAMLHSSVTTPFYRISYSRLLDRMFEASSLCISSRELE